MLRLKHDGVSSTRGLGLPEQLIPFLHPLNLGRSAARVEDLEPVLVVYVLQDGVANQRQVEANKLDRREALVDLEDLSDHLRVLLAQLFEFGQDVLALGRLAGQVVELAGLREERAVSRVEAPGRMVGDHSHEASST